MEERLAFTRSPAPQPAVRVDGSVYRTVEWSQGNLVVACHGGYRIGALVVIDAVGPDADTMQSVGIRGRITRVTPDGDAAVDFLHRDDAAMLALRALAEG
ncbi:MAG: hypothetical protein VW338_02475 [Rhodospirillaceae bacterium]